MSLLEIAPHQIATQSTMAPMRLSSEVEPVLASISSEPYILYDGDCPFCSNYVRLTRLRETLGSVNLIDARDLDEATLCVISKCYDLDEGMIFRIGGKTYWGADAVSAIAMMSQPSGPLSHLSAAIFRHQRLAQLLYPVMRLGRTATLKALGRRKINQ